MQFQELSSVFSNTYSLENLILDAIPGKYQAIRLDSVPFLLCPSLEFAPESKEHGYSADWHHIST